MKKTHKTHDKENKGKDNKDNKDNKEKETLKRVQWHDAFVAALKLELKEYKDYLTFLPEYEITNRPKFIDLILLKKDEIENEEGFIRFFSKVNVIEYKGVGDSLGMDALYKGMAYTSMYMSEIRMSECESDNNGVTLTFVRNAKPVKLMKQLREQNCAIVKEDKGIYTVSVTVLYCVRIIVLREVDYQVHPWISFLTRTLDEKKAELLIEHEKRIQTEWEQQNAKEVLEAIIQANLQFFQMLSGRRREDMESAIWDFMKPKIDAYVDEKMVEKDNKLVEKDKIIAAQGREIIELKKIIEKNRITNCQSED